MHEWIIANGEWGVAALMLLQNLFPLLPSEVIMPLAGFLASMGYLDLRTSIAAGLLGSLLGDLPWYFLGFALGEARLEEFAARHGRWVMLKRIHIQRAGQWFDRNSVKALLLGRLIPGLRTCVNIPAGVSRMAFLPFLAYTLIGETIWTAILACGGYLLGRDYRLIGHYLHFAAWGMAILASCALTVGLFIRRHGRRTA